MTAARADTTRPLATLFAPRSIAVVGASADPTKLSGRPLRYLQRYGYAGRVYPVNPRHEELLGLTCYPSVEALPEAADVALLLSPAGSVPDLVRACAAREVGFAVVIASGFAEAGNPEGQEELRRIARTTRTRVVGPNCVGLLSTASRVTATFSTVLQRGMPEPGPVSVVSQSGALANSILQSLQAMGVGVRHWISLGNEADLSALEVLGSLSEDPETRTVVLFAEGFKDGETFVSVARRACAAGKTVVLLHGGRTAAGREASLSHTGKLAGASDVGRALARQAGVIQVDTMSDLLDTIRIVSAGPSELKGLSVLTVSGGQGVLLSDAADRHGVSLAKLSDETRKRLAQVLPPTLEPRNPVDVALLGRNDRYFACARAVLGDAGTTHLLWVLSSLANSYEEMRGPLLDLAGEARAAGKRLIVSYLSPYDALPVDDEAKLRDAGVALFPYPEQAVAALGRGSGATGASVRPDARPVPGRLPGETPGWEVIERSLRRYGIAVPTSRLVADAEAARRAADEIGYPVALKLLAPGLAHKTEAGAVRLGLRTPADLLQAGRDMLAGLPPQLRGAPIEGFLVQEMVAGGIETLVGVRWDTEFGPVLSIGPGGTLTELIRDAFFLALPVTESEVRSALAGTRWAQLLAGFRGAPPADEDALVRTALALGRLYESERWIGEIELNPLTVLPSHEGAIALDVLVIGTGHLDARAGGAEVGRCSPPMGMQAGPRA